MDQLPRGQAGGTVLLLPAVLSPSAPGALSSPRPIPRPCRAAGMTPTPSALPPRCFPGSMCFSAPSATRDPNTSNACPCDGKKHPWLLWDVPGWWRGAGLAGAAKPFLGSAPELGFSGVNARSISCSSQPGPEPLLSRGCAAPPARLWGLFPREARSQYAPNLRFVREQRYTFARR